jgi:hypothetical protein
MPRILLTPKPGVSVMACVPEGEITPETLAALVAVGTAVVKYDESEERPNRYTEGRDDLEAD